MDKKFSAWQEFESGRFSPAYSFRNAGELPSGLYDIQYFELENRFALSKREFVKPEILTLPAPEIEELNNEMTKFFDSYDQLPAMGLPKSRGVLLYGAIGNGKSKSIESLVLTFLDRYKGVVFDLRDNEQLSYYIQFINSQFRILQPNSKVMTVCEDVERVTGNEQMMSLLLNMLDGINSAEHFFISTTNYPQKLDARLLRPGRYDRRIHLPLPDDRLREHFFTEMFRKSGYTPDNMNELVKKSDGFSYASLREFIFSLVVNKQSVDDTVRTLIALAKVPCAETGGRNSIGFGNNNYK